MNCPVHVGVEMRFVAVPAKKYTRRRGHAVGEVSAYDEVRLREGLLRCPVVGCPRVEKLEDRCVFNRQCSRCGRCSARRYFYDTPRGKICKQCYDAERRKL